MASGSASGSPSRRPLFAAEDSDSEITGAAPKHDSSGDEGDDSDSDDDDPIVKRIPVFFTPHYLSSLTLLQYPDRPPKPHTQHPLLPPSLRPGADPEPEPSRTVIKAKFKPISGHLQIEIPIEREPERWNEDQAKDFARGLPEDDEEGGKGKGKGKARGKGRKKMMTEEEEELKKREEERLEARRLDKITLGSLEVPDVTNYLVGVVKDDALHLTPVTQTYQLRPTLTYLDAIVATDRRAKRESKKNLDEDSDENAEVSDTELKKEAAKAVQVSVKQSLDSTNGPGGGGFGKGPLGGGNGRAGAGLFEPLRAMEGEAWIDLKHYHADTPQASIAFDGMFVSESNQSTKLVSITKPTEYLGA